MAVIRWLTAAGVDPTGPRRDSCHTPCTSA